jgi:hypothetical protein
MIEEYLIFSSTQESELADAVNRALKDGWQLHGNLIVIALKPESPDRPRPITYKYIREMIKVSKSSP